VYAEFGVIKGLKLIIKLNFWK